MKCMMKQCKSFLKMTALFETLLCLLTASSIGIAAQEPPVNPDSPATEYVRVYVDDMPYEGRAVLYEDTTYVDIYAFSEAIYDVEGHWDSGKSTAVITGAGIEIRAKSGDMHIMANERALFCPTGVMGDSTAMYVPLRVAAKALGATVSWNAEEFAAYVVADGTPILSGEDFYDKNDLFWLSRIIYAESGAEPFLGQMAVGNVVLNRVRATNFPNTVYGVIFDRKFGVQFTPAENGRIYCTPSERSTVAAKICLEGYTLSEDILYFINAALASNFWVPNNCEYVMAIGCHDFYA